MSILVSMTDIISYIVGFLSGAATTYLGYRLHIRSLAKERLSPSLERMLRIVRNIFWDSNEAKNLWNRTSQYQKALAIEKVVKPFSQSFAWGLLSIVSISYMQSLIENCREYELVFSEAEKSGIIERVRLYDSNLASALFWIHEKAQNKRDIESISDYADQAQTRLEKFLK